LVAAGDCRFALPAPALGDPLDHQQGVAPANLDRALGRLLPQEPIHLSGRTEVLGRGLSRHLSPSGAEAVSSRNSRANSTNATTPTPAAAYQKRE